MTQEMELKVKENIAQIIEFLKENADEEQTIFVDYNYRNGKWGMPEAHDYIIVGKDGYVETATHGSYCYSPKKLDTLDTWDMLQIVKQWADIKNSFFEQKQRIINKRNAEHDAVFNFTI